MSTDELDLFAPIATPEARLALWDAMYDALRGGKRPSNDLCQRFRSLMWLIEEEPRVAREFGNARRIKALNRESEDFNLVTAERIAPPEPGSQEAKQMRAARKRLGFTAPRKRGRPSKK